MKKLLSLVLATSITFSQAYAKDIGAADTNYGVENMIRFEIKDNKAIIYSPYSYLDDNHPAKQRALEESVVFFQAEMVEWVKFLYKFMQLEDDEVQKALEEATGDQSDVIAKLLQKKGSFEKELPYNSPDMMKYRELARKLLRKNSSDIAGMAGEQKINSITNQLAEDYKRQMALLMNNAVEHSRIVKENLALFPKNMDTWGEAVAEGAKSMYRPDVFMIQLSGTAITSILRNDIPEKANQKKKQIRDNIDKNRSDNLKQEARIRRKGDTRSWSKKLLAALKIHPLTSSAAKLLTSALDIHRYRFVFLYRPWVKTEVNLISGEVTQGYEHEFGANLLTNINVPAGHYIHDAKFLRLSVGGINGDIQNLSEFNKIMTGVSLNTPLGINLKAGVVSPLVIGAEAFSVDAFYYLVGAQRGISFSQIPKPAVAATGNGNGYGGVAPVFPGSNTPTPGEPTPVKPEPTKPKITQRIARRSGVDIAITFNLYNAAEKIGADFSGLHEDLLRLIGVDDYGSGYTYPYPYPKPYPGSGGDDDDDNPGIMPVFPGLDDGEGSGLFFVEKLEKWKKENNITNDYDFRKYLIYQHTGCDENCQSRYK